MPFHRVRLPGSRLQSKKWDKFGYNFIFGVEITLDVLGHLAHGALGVCNPREGSRGGDCLDTPSDSAQYHGRACSGDYHIVTPPGSRLPSEG